MTHHILFVDDEINVLKSLERSLFDYGELRFSFALGAEEGLKILNNESASVIVSDMKMPGMDGVDFLEKANGIYPDSVRMILSAYADIEDIMHAVNNGHVWRYITKPWEKSDLKVTLKNAVEFYEKKIETKRLLKEVEKKNEMLRDVNTTLEDRVRERTIQLENRNALLNMILESKPVEDIINKACESVSDIAGKRKTCVISDISGEGYCDKDVPDELKEIAFETLKNGKNIYEEKCVSIILSKSGMKLGALAVENDGSMSPMQVNEIVSTFASILSIALFHYKTVNDMPGLIDKLDEISGDL